MRLAEEVAEISRFGDFVWNYFLVRAGNRILGDWHSKNVGLEVALPGDTMNVKGTNHAA
jgi:hypothetical protein